MTLGPLERWRLVLGEAAEEALGHTSSACAAYDAALAWLYDREGDLGARGIRGRAGGSDEPRRGLGPSALTVPEWLDEVHRLFPRETIERMERDAVERYHIEEIVTNPEVLDRVEPNEALLRAVLRTKHLMNEDLLARARKLVAAVVAELVRKLAPRVQTSLSGTLDRRRSTAHRVAGNLDARRTIAKNLRHYRPEERRLYVERPYFFARTRRFSEQWQLILLVDQSASMLGSTIHAAVTASCLWSVPGLKTHLCAFDTSVIDLSRDVSDPVELLMKVQLGGGTDIARAVEYGAGLIENPRRSVIALITDFYEGGDERQLIARVRALCAQGTTFLGLAALDSEASPSYDRGLARRLVDAGASIGAMTPGQLASFIAEKVRGSTRGAHELAGR